MAGLDEPIGPPQELEKCSLPIGWMTFTLGPVAPPAPTQEMMGLGGRIVFHSCSVYGVAKGTGKMENFVQ